MITVEEASRIIFENLFEPAVVSVQPSNAVGRILAEPVAADRPFPPFNRVSMDGIAIQYDAWDRGIREFRIEGVQAAGSEPGSLKDFTNCIEVMTGAVLPGGCDTVIRYEDLSVADGRAIVLSDAIQRWQSVHLEGVDARMDDVLLRPGQLLSPSEIALLSSVGKTTVAIWQMPATAIISTGDELVDIEATPKAWQIRRSNASAVQAALRQMGCDAQCFHLSDEAHVLKDGLETILQNHDVLILSGGVSKGKFDFVPEALEAVGIRKLFHQVRQKPGKPFWFGASGRGKIAFALPGNPVSTFMCFYRYIKPWIVKSMGVEPPVSLARLTEDFSFSPPLTCFLQVSVRNDGAVLAASPVPGGGSGDFANLNNASGFLELPQEKSEFRAGEVFPFIAFRH